jgi:hypothetical protein
MNGTTWTAEEQKFAYENYWNKGVDYVALRLGRTKSAIRNKVYEIDRMGGEIKEKFKGLNSPNECPLCKGKNINEVTTYLKGVKQVYYCLDCMTEYTETKVLDPIPGDYLNFKKESETMVKGMKLNDMDERIAKLDKALKKGKRYEIDKRNTIGRKKDNGFTAKLIGRTDKFYIFERNGYKECILKVDFATGEYTFKEAKHGRA